MRVVLLNTYKHGGAGVAARRLQLALQRSGIQADILFSEDFKSKWPFYAERLLFLPFEHDKSVRFSFSLANFGHNVANHPLIQQADIIHLHWINQGFLSLSGLQALAGTGKPLVWTLHDMWTFTGGCHYSRGCMHFEESCGNCAYLRWQSPSDLSHRIWKKKTAKYPSDIQYVTCSAWLQKVALQSSLLRHSVVRNIPNPIDIQVFKPSNLAERNRFKSELGMQDGAFALLFVAMKVSETRKGFAYLAESLAILKEKQPNLPVEIVVMGKSEIEPLMLLPYPVHLLGMIQKPEDLAMVYGACDVFVIPSLEDNLPNTVMESLACGLPVAGFDTGGIPEMVSAGLEGEIVPQKDAEALANGIAQILGKESYRTAARLKAEQCYAEPIVAQQYIHLYKSLIELA